MLATVAFVNPHRGSAASSTPTYRRMAATDPRPRPVAELPLDLTAWPCAAAAHASCRDLTYRTLPAIAATVAPRERVQG